MFTRIRSHLKVYPALNEMMCGPALFFEHLDYKKLSDNIFGYAYLSCPNAFKSCLKGTANPKVLALASIGQMLEVFLSDPQNKEIIISYLSFVVKQNYYEIYQTYFHNMKVDNDLNKLLLNYMSYVTGLLDVNDGPQENRKIELLRMFYTEPVQSPIKDSPLNVAWQLSTLGDKEYDEFIKLMDQDHKHDVSSTQFTDLLRKIKS